MSGTVAVRLRGKRRRWLSCDLPHGRYQTAEWAGFLAHCAKDSPGAISRPPAAQICLS